MKAKRAVGKYHQIGNLRYFIPHSLPPVNPALEMNAEIISLYGEASFALGQLNEMSEKLLSPKRFIKAYVIKEALLSSAIEGVHTTLLDVFTHVLNDKQRPNKNTQLVLNYTHALETAFVMISKEKFPLVSRVILHTHQALMSVGEGDKATPGEFRKQSVRVGELIPPPAPEIPNLMQDFEKYINQSHDLPPLIQAGLAHVHFETIHPFLDGNGRIGRMLIVLMLVHSGLLKLPILYPSYYFKKHHLKYYQKLDRVRTHGDFEGWMSYYLQAIKESAIDAHRRAKEIENLENKLRNKIQTDKAFSKMRETAQEVIEALFDQPITGASEMSKRVNRSYNTVQNIFKIFCRHHFLSKGDLRKRHQMYRFDPYMKLLEKEYS